MASLSVRTLAAVLAIGLALIGAPNAWADEAVTFNMSWLPQGSAVGPIVARQQGWFRQAGLDVKIIRGYGGGRTANELDQGQFEVGYVDPISLILNRVNGGRIQLVGAINTRWPAGICYSPSRQAVKSLDDLKGLRMGGGSASPVQRIIPVWLEMNGKPRDFIHLLRLDPAVVEASLIEGRVDLAECWQASNLPVVQKQARTAGVDIAWINYSDFGLNAYGSGFAAREDTIQGHPALLRGFLRESYRGYAFARANPAEAAALMIQLFPALDPAVAEQQIREIGALIVDPDVAARGLGYLREDRLRDTLSFVDKAFDLHGKVGLGEIATNALLNEPR